MNKENASNLRYYLPRLKPFRELDTGLLKFDPSQTLSTKVEFGKESTTTTNPSLKTSYAIQGEHLFFVRNMSDTRAMQKLLGVEGND